MRVVENFGSGPIGKGADLYRIRRAIEDIDSAAGFTLLAAQTCEVSSGIPERFGERPHLADIAAEVALGNSVVEQIGTMGVDHGGYFSGIRTNAFDGNAVTRFHLIHELQSGLRQATGIQGEDANAAECLQSEIDDRDAFALQAGDDDERIAELICCTTDDSCGTFDGSVQSGCQTNQMRTEGDGIQGRCAASTAWKKFGAGDGIRTRDINLGKVALYQLSYSRVQGGTFILARPRTACQTPC